MFERLPRTTSTATTQAKSEDAIGKHTRYEAHDAAPLKPIDMQRREARRDLDAIRTLALPQLEAARDPIERMRAAQRVQHMLMIADQRISAIETSAKDLTQLRRAFDVLAARARDLESPHAIAARGVASAASPLPHASAIQASFGRHDISQIRTTTGGDAAAALGAKAYATGSSIAFAEQPDLHTAAHEAAHVVQQRAGVSLDGGMGRDGDAYEEHADAVADAVVDGRSAEALLDAFVAGPSNSGLQFRTAKAPSRAKSKVDLAPIRTELEGMQSIVFHRVKAANTYLKAGLPALAEMQLAIDKAATNYAIAHAQHKRICEKASKTATERNSLISNFVGIGTGVAIGLISSALLPATLPLGIAVMAEVGGEVAELFVGKAIGQLTEQKTDIKPLTFGPDAIRTKHYQKLIQLYQGLVLTGTDATSTALVLNAITALVGQARLLQHGAPADVTAEQIVALLHKLRRIPTEIGYRAGGVESLRFMVGKQEGDVLPDSHVMEQYVWINWISQFGAMDEEDGTYTYGDTDVLDNDTIEDYLHGPIGVLGSGGLLRVSFGGYTSEADEQRAVRAAEEMWSGQLQPKMKALTEDA